MTGLFYAPQATPIGLFLPLTLAEVFRRQGLGMSAARGLSREFVLAVTEILREYAGSERETDLVFAADFSKEQRAKIHSLAQQMRLKSQSYGSGDERQLCIIKVHSLHGILDSLRRQGGESGKYRLLPPQPPPQ